MSSIRDGLKRETRWTIRRYKDNEAFKKGESYKTSEIKGNLTLNEGADEALKLMVGITATAWATANAKLGVGTSATGELATQTGLVATGVNQAYVAIATGFPTVATQKVTWRGVFATGVANFAWNEFTVSNATDNTGVNLNRKVSAQGTKTAGQTWTLDLDITMS